MEIYRHDHKRKWPFIDDHFIRKYHIGSLLLLSILLECGDILSIWLFSHLNWHSYYNFYNKSWALWPLGLLVPLCVCIKGICSNFSLSAYNMYKGVWYYFHFLKQLYKGDYKSYQVQKSCTCFYEWFLQWCWIPVRVLKTISWVGKSI